MLNEIIEEVSRRVKIAEGRRAVFNDRHYTPVDFSEDNYYDIGSSSNKAIVFVDGGNAELITAPGLSLQIIRNAAVVIKNNKLQRSKKQEFYVFLTTEGNKAMKARIYNGTETEIVGAVGNDLTNFCDRIRKSSEIKFATGMVNDAEIIVLDGTLDAANEMEKNHFEELYYEAHKKGVIVAAIAKTTSMMTDKGDSFAAMLNQRGPDRSWYYYPVTENNSEMHRAEILFVKLHEKSKHVFRTEIYNRQKDKMAEVVAELKENARELTFPGYPYGLILADRLARVSDKDAEYLKAKIFAAAGSKWNELRKNLAAVDAHEILDNM